MLTTIECAKLAAAVLEIHSKVKRGYSVLPDSILTALVRFMFPGRKLNAAKVMPMLHSALKGRGVMVTVIDGGLSLNSFWNRNNRNTRQICYVPLILTVENMELLGMCRTIDGKLMFRKYLSRVDLNTFGFAV